MIAFQLVLLGSFVSFFLAKEVLCVCDEAASGFNHMSQQNRLTVRNSSASSLVHFLFLFYLKVK